jgi:protein TonB
MALSATTYPVDEGLKRPMTLSIAFHAALAAMLVVSTIYSHRGENWGGPGGASRVVDESKGLYKSEPQPKAPPPPDATPIPKFEKNKPPKYVTRPSRTLENPTPPPQNAVPYGGGGTPTVPYASFTMGAGTQGGMGFTGAGGGNFGSRFPWYVEAVQRRVSSNWLQTTVDPSIGAAPRAVVTFDILRDGSVTNIQVTRSSGNSSVDTSAVRAIRASSPLERLPGEYSGSKVSVEFWFDFHR